MNDFASLWAGYEPDDKKPWDLGRVVHLHRRAGFAATWGEVQRDLKDGPKASVDRLLTGKAGAASPPEFAATADLLADAAGRFRVEGMLPGEKHELGFALDKKVIVPAANAPVKGLSAASGEVKDVGEIKVSVRPGKK